MTRKYLTYALGEIVLVIMGILLALQIDEWNNQRIATIELKNDLEYVLEDLEDDRMQLLQLKIGREQAVMFCSDIIDKYLKSESFEDKNDIKLKSIFYELKFERNLNGFERVSASQLFQSNKYASLRKQIDIYDKEIERLVFDEQRLNYFIEENERAMFANGSFVRIYENKRRSKGYAGEDIPIPSLNWLEELSDNPPFKAILLRFEDDVNQFMIPQYDVVISAGSEVKDEIGKILKE